MAQCAAAAGRALDGLGAPAHLVGHSLGAVAALALAQARPEAVRTLALIEPVLFAAGAGGAGHDALWAAQLPIEDALARGDRERALEVFARLWDSPWYEVAPGQKAYMLERIHLVLATKDDLWEDRLGLLAPGRPEGLVMPVLLAETERAQPAVPEILDVLEARIPGARRARLPGGHMSPVTHSAATAEALAAFWGSGAP